MKVAAMLNCCNFFRQLPITKSQYCDHSIISFLFIVRLATECSPECFLFIILCCLTLYPDLSSKSDPFCVLSLRNRVTKNRTKFIDIDQPELVWDKRDESIQYKSETMNINTINLNGNHLRLVMILLVFQPIQNKINSKFILLVLKITRYSVSHLMNIVRNNLVKYPRIFQSKLSQALQYNRKLDTKGILHRDEKYITNEACNALFLLSELVLKLDNDDDPQQQQIREKNKNKVTQFDNIAQNALKRWPNYLQQRFNSNRQCIADNKKDDIKIKQLNCALYIVVTFKQQNEMLLIDDTTKTLDERITGMNDVYDHCVEYFAQQMEQFDKGMNGNRIDKDITDSNDNFMNIHVLSVCLDAMHPYDKTPFLKSLEHVVVVTLSSFVKFYSDIIRLMNGILEQMRQEVMASGLINELTTNNDQSRSVYFSAMKEKMDLILHCNGLEIHIGINTAANIEQECIDDVVNGIQDLCHEISNNLAKCDAISTSDVGDLCKDTQIYLDYVRVNIAWSNYNGNNHTTQMIVSLVSIARKDTLELITDAGMRTVLNVDDLDVFMFYLMKLQPMRFTNCRTLFQTKKQKQYI